MVKGHAGGSIIKQFGSKAGSKFEGMTFEGHLLDAEGPQTLEHYHSQDVPNEDEGFIEAAATADNISQLSQISQRDKCVHKSQEAFLEMEKMASQSDSIAQTMHAKLNRTLHDLKIQEHCQLVCGKEVLTSADMFVRPNGLTLKRRIGVVDKYHGSNRTKRLIKNYLTRKRQQDQERDDVVGICL
jgi:hypothetical protein